MAEAPQEILRQWFAKTVPMRPVAVQPSIQGLAAPDRLEEWMTSQAPARTLMKQPGPRVSRP